MGYLQLSSSQVLFIYLLQGGVEIIPDDPTKYGGGFEVMRGNNWFMDGVWIGCLIRFNSLYSLFVDIGLGI